MTIKNLLAFALGFCCALLAISWTHTPHRVRAADTPLAQARFQIVYEGRDGTGFPSAMILDTRTGATWSYAVNTADNPKTPLEIWSSVLYGNSNGFGTLPDESPFTFRPGRQGLAPASRK